MLNKLEKAKILHQHEHYKINAKVALKNGNTELAKEYDIRLETIKRVLDALEIEPYKD